MITNIMKTSKQKIKKSPLLAQNEVRADIFSGSLAVCLFASASRRGGRKGGSVFALPPAEPIGRKISSDIFKYTPPVGIFQVRGSRLASLGGQFVFIFGRKRKGFINRGKRIFFINLIKSK